MYIPKQYLGQSKEHAIAFMNAYPFGLFISSSEDIPVATHLPFLIEENEDEITIISHLAKANEQLNQLENKQVLVVFSEPHAYISPKHYNSPVNVPTWNYVSVHAYGKVQFIQDKNELNLLMEKTISIFEPSYLEQYRTQPSTYLDGLMRAVIGIKIKVEKLQFKEKLSQDKTEEERQKIIDSFEKNGDHQQHAIAKYMKQLLKT